MKGHTYRDLALRYEVDVCLDGCFRRDHRRGAVDSQGLIHWSDRAVTRSGLRRFLMLVHRVEGYLYGGPAERIYHEHMFAYRTALFDLGIRLPAKLSAVDKARLRSMLARSPFVIRNGKVGRWAGLR